MLKKEFNIINLILEIPFLIYSIKFIIMNDDLER
jgi:hypothetical protein